jgi:hypothetical protein
LRSQTRRRVANRSRPPHCDSELPERPGRIPLHRPSPPGTRTRRKSDQAQFVAETDDSHKSWCGKGRSVFRRPCAHRSRNRRRAIDEPAARRSRWPTTASTSRALGGGQTQSALGASFLQRARIVYESQFPKSTTRRAKRLAQVGNLVVTLAGQDQKTRGRRDRLMGPIRCLGTPPSTGSAP